MELKDKIKELRKSHKYSQQDLADLLGVSRQSVSKWEKGESNPDLAKIMQMSKTFNVSFDEFLADKDPEEEEAASAKERSAEAKREETAKKRIAEQIREEIRQEFETRQAEIDAAKEKERQIPFNRLKSLAVILFRTAMNMCVWYLIFAALIVIFQDSLFPLADTSIVSARTVPYFTLIKILCCCLICIIFSHLCSKSALSGNYNVGFIIIAASVLNVFMLIPFRNDATFAESEFIRERILNLQDAFNGIGIFFFIALAVFNIGVGFLLVLRKISPTPYEKEAPIVERNYTAMATVLGLLVGVFGTPILWAESFIIINRQNSKRPLFSALYTKYNVIGMLIEVLLVVLAVAIYYVALNFIVAL